MSKGPFPHQRDVLFGILIAPPAREREAQSCNIDLVTLGNSLIFEIINSIFIFSAPVFKLCLVAEPKNIIFLANMKMCTFPKAGTQDFEIILTHIKE